MVRITSWKIFLILAVCLFGVLFSLPNALDEKSRTWMKENLPSFIPTSTVNLGLDLRGGAHLLFEVDMKTLFIERVDTLVNDLRDRLRDQKIPYGRIAPLDKGVRISFKDKEDSEKIKKIIRSVDPLYIVNLTPDGNVFDISMDVPQVKTIQDQAIAQSIEIVRRRVDELGTTEPTIQRQGTDRIVVQVPGANSDDVKRIIGKTAKMGFHLVSEPGQRLAGDLKLPFQEEPGRELAVKRRPVITGDMLETAQPTFDQNGQAVVSFRLNGSGAGKFCDVTRNNIGKPFAIVLDNEIISAPVIRDAICAGQGQISGGFDVRGANDLALLLRAGALPAPMNVVEERTVGPSLGADSVAAGKKACLVALGFVIVFSCFSYGLFGIFASIGLVINMVLILGVLSLIQATLTLPGIAGIVLTIGLAVDGNVLVFERIKEELRSGRSVLSAIDTGYTRAKTTITDSNLTSLIAALILFSFGTGPIKGFAVTMCIGVVTSYFCAMMLTRLIILSWLRWAKPATIPV